jgi:hypothetical protein
MVTDNCGLAEVTKAAERMVRAFPKTQKPLPQRAQRHTKEQHRGVLGNALLYGFPLCAYVLSVVRILTLSEPSTQLLGHEFVH